MRTRTAILSAFALTALLAACATSIVMGPVPARELREDETFDAYLFAGGLRQSLRAVFLIDPESPAEVVSRTPGVIRGRVKAGSALEFVGGDQARVDVRRVSYQGKTAGYLITQRRPYPVGRYELDTRVSVSQGKLLFSVSEPTADY